MQKNNTARKLKRTNHKCTAGFSKGSKDTLLFIIFTRSNTTNQPKYTLKELFFLKWMMLTPVYITITKCLYSKKESCEVKEFCSNFLKRH